MTRAIACAVLLAAACFSPTYQSDLACGPEGECPRGFDCDEAAGVCRPGQVPDGSAAGLDAAPIDARYFPPDGPLPDARPDAMPVECAGDEDCQTPPNLCLLPGTCDLESSLCDFPAVDCSHLDGECRRGVCNFGDGQCLIAPANGDQLCGAEPSCEYGDCEFEAGMCDQTGIRTGTCIEHRCSAAVCAPSSVPSQLDCERDTEGDSCGSTTCGAPFGPCVYEGDATCDQSGTRSTTCVALECAGGDCAEVAAAAGSEPCSRITAGDTCRAETCGAPSLCGGYSNACDITGTQSRTCTTFACAGDECEGTSRIESQDCTRPSQDGMTCMPTECDLDGCSFEGSACDETGFQTCNAFTCSGTTCTAESFIQPCSRDTDGDICDFQPCPQTGMVSICCTAGICAGVCPGDMCPDPFPMLPDAGP